MNLASCTSNQCNSQWYQLLLATDAMQQMQYLQTMWPQHATPNSKHNQYNCSTVLFRIMTQKLPGTEIYVETP